MAKLERRRKFFKSFEAKSLKSRNMSSLVADDLTNFCSTPFFLYLNIVFFIVWIAVNSGYIPFVHVFDPFPFGLLTMAVSLEAIMLSIFVLVSQNRTAKIDTIREEVHLQINLRAEEEITKILQMLHDVQHKLGIDKKDPELHDMLERTDAGYIERSIIAQIERSDKPAWEQLVREFPDILHIEGKADEEKK
jgi:uncharacterized membrane protein